MTFQQSPARQLLQSTAHQFNRVAGGSLSVITARTGQGHYGFTRLDNTGTVFSPDRYLQRIVTTEITGNAQPAGTLTETKIISPVDGDITFYNLSDTCIGTKRETTVGDNGQVTDYINPLDNPVDNPNCYDLFHLLTTENPVVASLTATERILIWDFLPAYKAVVTATLSGIWTLEDARLMALAVLARVQRGTNTLTVEYFGGLQTFVWDFDANPGIPRHTPHIEMNNHRNGVSYYNNTDPRPDVPISQYSVAWYPSAFNDIETISTFLSLKRGYLRTASGLQREIIDDWHFTTQLWGSDPASIPQATHYGRSFSGAGIWEFPVPLSSQYRSGISGLLLPP